MSYMVLARRWRPRLFSELVGQEHVQRALVNALDEDRLHHAFLFTGTRGVGKTTIARILAKCLNCEKGVSSVPCGECAACTEIDEGRFVDLIEVDAASRTKVDDTRELLENVQYSPTRGRYKVYLIDEVHMLSAHSFNALLKTLEEPPPHVKFLLATTDPQKLPVTVLSRCLQFNLKRLPIALIQGQLEKILLQDNIAFEQVALELLARSADGSMRDALSLLDQAIAFAGGKLTEAEVRKMLGAIDKRHVFSLLDCLAEGDIAGALQQVREFDEMAPDYEAALAALAETLHKLAMHQAAPIQSDEDSAERDAIERLARGLDRETVQLFYQIALTGRRDLPLAPDPRSGFEMLLLRMHAFEPASFEGDSSGSETGHKRGGTGKRTSKPAPRAASPAPERDVKAKPAKKPANKSAEQNEAGEAPGVAGSASGFWKEPDWKELVGKLSVKGGARQLAANCGFVNREGPLVALVLDAGHEHLLTSKLQASLAASLSEYFGEPLKLRIDLGKPGEETLAQEHTRQQDEIQAKAQKTIEKDPNINALVEAFDAEVQPDSIKPVA
ncbi:MAG: DNA polymerase III subunit gamma/tau [Gammaproteobacteria bacterium]|nr:DNA polymerase III subunit gamma/tau [Gammaproteobacteria bacterium]